MIKVIIYGPTAIGKTSLSVHLAKILNAEIISADSAQVYKYMNIGTSKIKSIEKDEVIHHLIDILEPKEKFSAYLFKENVENILGNLKNKKKNAIIVGGTAFYIRALIEGLSQTPSSNIEIRDNLMKKDTLELYNELSKVDKEALIKIPLNNKFRLVRALEVFYISGKKFSSYNQECIKKIDNFYKYCLLVNRETLYKRIDKRVDLMIEEGLVEEVKSLFTKYGMIDLIGYKEIIEYLQNKNSFEFSINKIKKNSRDYAKRQITWLNKLKDFKLVDIEKEDPLTYILKDIKNMEEQ